MSGHYSAVSKERDKSVGLVTPIGKHPKSEVTNLLRSKHIKQVRRIGIMNVVVTTSMSKEEVDFVEGGDIRD